MIRSRVWRAVMVGAGRCGEVCYIPLPEDLRGKYQNYTCADMSKYKTDLKLAKDDHPCRYSIEEGVADYVRNYLLKDERW